MNIQTQTLLTLAALAANAGVPAGSTSRIDLTPDFFAGQGSRRIRLFHPARVHELRAVIAERKARAERDADEHDPAIQ